MPQPEIIMILTLILALVRVVVNASETLAIGSEFQDSGVYSWAFRRARYRWTASSLFAKPLDLALRAPAYLWLSALQVGCALTLLPMIFIRQSAVLPLLAIVLAIELLSSLRNGAYGAEGSDLMELIVLTALTVYNLTSDPVARMAVLWFIALQAMLAYCTSGVVKLQSRHWRSGAAIRSILSTQNYGARTLNDILRKAPGLARFVCWGVILFECTFPLIVFFGPTPTLVLLGCGAFFHLTIAASMGLNAFVWSFVSTYPAIYGLSHHFQVILHANLAR